MALFVPAVGPPALVPLYFQWYIFYFAVQRKQWVVSHSTGASPGFGDESQCQIYWELCVSAAEDVGIDLGMVFAKEGSSTAFLCERASG